MNFVMKKAGRFLHRLPPPLLLICFHIFLCSSDIHHRFQSTHPAISHYDQFVVDVKDLIAYHISSSPHYY